MKITVINNPNPHSDISPYSKKITNFIFHATQVAINIGRSIFSPKRVVGAYQLYSGLTHGLKVEKIEYEYSTFDERDYDIFKKYN